MRALRTSIKTKLSLLADFRETPQLRGFHLASALKLAVCELRDVKLYALGGEKSDELLAIESFVFDTGFKIHRWRWDALRFARQLDLYVAVAEEFPSDVHSSRLRQLARQSVIGMTFYDRGVPSYPPIVPANDTVAFAREICARLISIRQNAR